MSKYQEKRKEVEARLYQGVEQGIELLKWLGREGILYGDGRLEASGYSVRPGDYIVKLPSGSFFVLDPVKFAERYEEVDE